MATGARAVAGSIRRLQPAGRVTHSFASSHSGAQVCSPSGRGTSIAAAPWRRKMLALALEGDPKRAGAMHMAGMAAGARDDLDQAVELYEESARLAREQGDMGIVTIAVNNLGHDRGPARGLRARAGAVGGSPSDQPQGPRSPPRCARAVEHGHDDVDARRPRARARAAARRSGGGARDRAGGPLHRGVRRSGWRTHARIRHVPRACSAAPTRCARKRRSATTSGSRGAFATKRKQGCGQGWGRTGAQRRTPTVARSRSRTG